MSRESDVAEADDKQRVYARLAGALFLGEVVLAIGSGLIIDHVAGHGGFAETAATIAAAEHLYRAALSIVVIVSLSSALLAFSQYAVLKPVNSLIAQLAMIFSLGDSFLALLVRMFRFVIVHLYVSARAVGTGTVSTEAAVDLLRAMASTTENIGGIAFGIGSFLFFWLFFKSRYIPRALSALGVFASAIWSGLYFANLLFPEQHGVFQDICLPPMALADVLTGFYLIRFGIRTQARRERGPAIA